MENKVLIICPAKSKHAFLTDLLNVTLQVDSLYDIVTTIAEKDTSATYLAIVAMGQDAITSLGLSGTINVLKAMNLVYDNAPLLVTDSPASLDFQESSTEIQRIMLSISTDLHNAFVAAFGAGKVDPNFNESVLCTSADQIRDLYQVAKHCGRLAIDIETVRAESAAEDSGSDDDEEDSDVPKREGKAEVTDSALNRNTCGISVISLCAQPGYSLVVPVEHSEYKWTDDMQGALKELFADKDIDKVAHNSKYDFFVLSRYGFDIAGRWIDTVLLHHQLSSNMPHKLKPLVAEYFPSVGGYEDALAKYNNDWNAIPMHDLLPYTGMDVDTTLRLSYIIEEQLIDRSVDEYMCYRNIMSAALKPLFTTEYRGCRINRELLAEAAVEATALKESLEAKINAYPEVQAFNRARLEAAKQAAIDKQRAAIDAQLKKFTDKLKEAEANMAEATALQDAKLIKKCTTALEKARKAMVDKNATWLNAEARLRSAMEGHVSWIPFNPASTPALSSLLYDKGVGFEFEPVKLEGESLPSRGTSSALLNEIDDPSGFIETILVYRGISKTLSTYLTAILRKTDANGYLHGSFNLAGTKTFRMSASDPNLQNVISRSKFDDVMKIASCVKKSFVPEPGEVLLQIDLSQAELRMIAHYADETNMLAAYNSGKDLHKVGACKTMHISEEEFNSLSKEEQKSARQRAKARNFGLIYGMSAQGYKQYAWTSYGVALTAEEAEEERLNFFRMFPRLLAYHEDMQNFASANGCVTTLFGGRCPLPDTKSFIPKYRSAALRNAINSPIQGTVGQLTIFAIALLGLRLDPRVRILNSVHDSVIMSVPRCLLDETVRICRATLENAPLKQFFGVELKVKMAVDFEASYSSWKEVMPLDEFLGTEANVNAG